MAYELVQGALLPPLRIQVTRSPAPVGDVLLPGDVCELRWRRPDGTTGLVSLVVEDAATGVVRRDWIDGDTDLPGEHRAQVVINGATTPEVFPSGEDGPEWVSWPIRRRL